MSAVRLIIMVVYVNLGDIFDYQMLVRGEFDLAEIESRIQTISIRHIHTKMTEYTIWPKRNEIQTTITTTTPKQLSCRANGPVIIALRTTHITSQLKETKKQQIK